MGLWRVTIFQEMFILTYSVTNQITHSNGRKKIKIACARSFDQWCHFLACPVLLFMITAHCLRHILCFFVHRFVHSNDNSFVNLFRLFLINKNISPRSIYISQTVAFICALRKMNWTSRIISNWTATGILKRTTPLRRVSTSQMTRSFVSYSQPVTF